MISRTAISDETPAGEARARARLQSRPPALLLVPLVTACALTAIAAGWMLRGQRYVSPDRGLGYWLGVLGLAAMLLLLLYPVRKRGWAFRGMGPIRLWFHLHMALGILGPTLVLLHSNFELGSLNSTIALGSALLVGSSGYVGRFAYSRIHYGLSGQRARFSEVRQDVREFRDPLGEAAPGLSAQFEAFEQWATASEGSLGAALVRFAGARRRIDRLRARIPWSRLERAAPELARRLEAYLDAALRLARFAAYERLFGLWHALHVPLSFFLFGAALVHIVAVHLY